MPYLMFELQCDDERVAQYQEFLRLNALGIEKSSEFLRRVLQLMTPPQDKCDYHSVVFTLARHVAEEVDAISILLTKGCVDPCKSHLRSALEADLAVRYILETDSERRGLSYQVKEARDRLRANAMYDGRTKAGKEFREALRVDPIGAGVLASAPIYDFDAEEKRLRTMLTSPPWAPINAEWESKGARSKWHSLFGGPKSIRELATKLKRVFWYEILYSSWSGRIHAGEALRNIGINSKEPGREGFAVRPLRHPEGINTVYSFGQSIAVGLGNTLGQKYLSRIGNDDVKKFYIEEIQPVYHRIRDVKISADWH